MPTMDQVVWANVNVSVAGEPGVFKRGDLLPEAASAEEQAQRHLLRLGGAIRIVEVVYTPDELAAMAGQRGEATAARESAFDVDPAVPLAEQTVRPEPGRPTLMEPSGAPVVIGDEDLRAEHAQQAERAREAREAAAQQPPQRNAPKAAWVSHAVEVHGADRAEAEKLSRDQLAARYTDPPGTVSQGGGAAGGGPQPQLTPQPPPSAGTDSPGPQPPQPGPARPAAGPATPASSPAGPQPGGR